ncbi:hypothetical protein LPJ78_000618 [Coemansia sp. RSA 989]|nr:hypothetical protein BX667DRAFT_517107 [Coemansia mojavensis]KAJ1744183.1 hypothetical protein LPJ68_000243 [Coemansia sp. RSA 1086]KAJ1750014.1 hypothetical protein LPJ79_003262 [Coemansia sp. RSA 1821]KAJ1867919.1 hypothetical protein LPJ78_000618 [Coemansia sp. RSA 989]KAJ1874472.1 hypothetical protein LPJ55_001471 [Coemansia sp. RSA 990]KAJ2633410.1 hypothetical protein H4R22_000511 [Coemansia sp. RSA 1290]KAJ2653101.1 hypothetical protein IWW40_000755 [Coemansia sp. RSA 1250]KAJ26761
MHNNASIREDEAVRRTTWILRQLYAREHGWFKSRTPEQVSLLTQQGQLTLSEQLHYGEIAFLLLRLKPCTIIDFAGDRKQLENYIGQVIAPSLRDLNAVGALSLPRNCTGSTGACYPRPFNLVCARISGALKSPQVDSWTGAYVVYDEKWNESADWVKDHLLNSNKTFIAEDELAKGLDYPGSIPKTPEDMHSIVPVSYLGRMKSESGEWLSDRWECLTSFVVLQKELPQTALHRIRYQAVKMFGIEMQVNMDTSMIDEFPAAAST